MTKLSNDLHDLEKLIRGATVIILHVGGKKVAIGPDLHVMIADSLGVAAALEDAELLKAAV